MNDDELITAVKESVTGVHMTTPAGQIVRRSRAIRARRRIPALAGSLAVAAGAALALAALLPAGHQPGHSRLAAWTVAKQADGAISVTIHQLRDPAGLQSTLRADGLPATVSFSVSGPPLNPSCQPHPATKPLLSSVFPVLTPTGHIRLVINPRPCQAERACPFSIFPTRRMASSRTGSRSLASGWSAPARNAPAAKPPGEMLDELTRPGPAPG